MKKITWSLYGKEIVPEHIVGFSELKTFSTGSMMCDWCYGVVLYYVGGKIKIKFKHLTSNSQKEEAENERLGLIEYWRD